MRGIEYEGACRHNEMRNMTSHDRTHISSVRGKPLQDDFFKIAATIKKVVKRRILLGNMIWGGEYAGTTIAI